MGNGLLQSIADNVTFVLVCVGVAVSLFAIAYAAEKYVYRRDGITERIFRCFFLRQDFISWISVRFRH